MPDAHTTFAKPTKRKKQGLYGRGDKAKATKLHSEIIRSIGECERCATRTARLETAHIISRRYSATRTLLNGAFCLCSRDHRYFTEHPLEFARFVTTTPLRGVYDQLYELSQLNQKYPKTFWSDRLTELRRIKAQLDSGELTLTEAREQEAKREGLR